MLKTTPFHWTKLIAIMVLLSACQKAEQPPTEVSQKATEDQQPQVAAAQSVARMATFDLSKADFSPIGHPDCDAFMDFAKQCFRTTKIPGADVVIAPYFEHFRMLRNLASETPQPSILNTLCKQQLDSRPQLKTSLKCEA